MGHPCCLLARGRIFWTVKFLQNIQHQCSKTKESTATNSWQEKFSPSPHKWQQDSAQLGLCPIDWWWQEVNEGPQKHLSPLTEPLLAGCRTVSAWDIAPVPGVPERGFRSVPRGLEIKSFPSLSALNGSFPPQTRLFLQEHCVFYSRLAALHGELCWSCVAQQCLWYGHAAQFSLQTGLT